MTEAAEARDLTETSRWQQHLAADGAQITPTMSPTAQFLDEAIRNSSLTQAKIAARASFPKPSVLSMMKLGPTKDSLVRIPGPADAPHLDRTEFLEIAPAEYDPEVCEILKDVLGLPLDRDEEDLIAHYRVANVDWNIRFNRLFRGPTAALFYLAPLAADCGALALLRQVSELHVVRR